MNPQNATLADMKAEMKSAGMRLSNAWSALDAHFNGSMPLQKPQIQATMRELKAAEQQFDDVIVAMNLYQGRHPNCP